MTSEKSPEPAARQATTGNMIYCYICGLKFHADADVVSIKGSVKHFKIKNQGLVELHHVINCHRQCYRNYVERA
jgi:hypothetical protein